MYKIYQSIRYQTYYLKVKIGSKIVDIPFTGGSLSPVKVMGKFSTSDKKIIEALDNHSQLGKNFKCIKVVEPKVEDSPVKEGFKDVSGITTVQDAKEWLVQNLEGIKVSDLTNKVKVLMCAEANKINFTNLPK